MSRKQPPVVVTYVQGDGRKAMTAVGPAELAALQRAGRVVHVHDQAAREVWPEGGRGGR